MTYENPTYEEAVRWANEHFRSHYKKTLSKLVQSDTPGYWVDTELCYGECGMGHMMPMYHTYDFSQPGRDGKGRFLRPYRAWEIIRKTEKKVPP